MSKLWPHVTLPDPRLAALWPHVGGAKELNGTATLALAMGAGVPIRILRDTGTDGAGADDAVRLLLNHDLSVVTHVQLSCESGRSGDPTWQQAVIAGIRAQAPHLQVVGFGFPTGNPTQVVHEDHEHFPQWVALAPVLALVDAVGVDEYFGCLVDDPAWGQWLSWTAERHQLVRTCLGKHGIAMPPVIILESGLDHVIPGVPNGGWLTRGVAPDDYWRTLLAVNALDEQDPNVLGRCLYTFGATPDWAGYECLPLIPRMQELTMARSVPVINQNFNGNATVQCGPTAAAEILQRLGKRFPDLTDEQWVQLCFQRIHPGVAWQEYGVLTTPQEIVDGIAGWFPDIQVAALFSFAEVVLALGDGKLVEGFVDARQFLPSDTFYHFLAIDQISDQQAHLADPDRSLDGIPEWVPLSQLQMAEEAAPSGPYGIAFWTTPPAIPAPGDVMPSVAPGFTVNPDGSWRCTVPGCPYTVSQGFLAYYQKMGSLAVFGYPRSDAFPLRDGTAQWFQRARMEWDPKNGVQLGLIGDELMQREGLLK